MKDSARYAKIVEWSEEDQCFVGSSPGLIYGGRHGQDEREVFDQLCQVVEEAIELYKEDGETFASSYRNWRAVERCASHRDRGAPC